MKAPVQGRLALVLHAHLPYVRHPEHPRFFEETWLFEAITECYLPLAWICDDWTRDGIPWRLSLTLTPTLCEMLGDPFLEQRYQAHLESQRELARKEQDRTAFDSALRPLAELHHQHLERCRSIPRPGSFLVGQFRKHQDAGHLEILNCAATHALLPLLTSEPASVRAQLSVAHDSYAARFGREPRGFWLPECGWAPELEPALKEAGIRWFVLETHGVLQGQPPPPAAVFAPVQTPGGLFAFGRDPSSARQVWSRTSGYPGDPRYREFHRDLGHDAEWEYIGPHLSTARRTFTGFKYHRITGHQVPGDAKEVYQPAAAAAAVADHAAHFVAERLRILSEAGHLLGRTPFMVAPYDAELFGHWWHEGPAFLDQVVRRMCRPDSGLSLVTPGEVLDEEPQVPVSMPAASTWGEGGHLGVWLDESNAWMQTPLRRAGWTMRSLADRFSGRPLDGNIDRALRQAGRELLLAQSSDWPFLVRMGTAGDYPAVRFQQHTANFKFLAEGLMTAGDTGFLECLAGMETRNPLFAGLDWRAWCSGRT